MSIINPDILAEGRDFSIAFCAVGLAVGLLLWLTGWRAHRFWIVLFATLAAGITGLLRAQQFGVQPLVAGLLLAIAAGVLALALIRVIAFLAAGFACVVVVRSLPPAPWQEPIICFLAGGLLGLLLFRVWTMALTGFAGAVLMGYFGLWLADRLGQVDAVLLAAQQSTLVNSVCAAVGIAGAVVQYLWDRRLLRRQREGIEYAQARRNWRRTQEPKRWFGRQPFRRAG